jgi:hypothetical protein
MAQLKTPKAQEFDTLVIGAGLSGLIVANALDATGRNVALVEAADHIGGASRMGSTQAGSIDHGLKLIPESQAAHEAIDWLETVLGEKVDRSIVEAAPVNYDDGKFKPYVGFGDTVVTTSSEVEAYAINRRLLLSSTPKDWVVKLGELFSGTLLTQSQVTKMAIEDGFVIESLLNGAKRISAREVVFAGAPNTLIPVLPEGALAPRIRQKLLRGDFWTSVNLDLVHPSPVTDSHSVHVLKGANEEPTVGVFHEPRRTEDGRLLQVSQWFTLIPRDQIDEEELVAGALKQIKRQIKRAYEAALEGLVQERILVSSASHGSLKGAFDAPGRLPKIANLWLTSSFFSEERNTLGTLIQTRNVIEDIGEHSTDNDLHKDSEVPRTAEA